MTHRLRVPEIVDRHDLEVATPLEIRAEEVPPDPPEPVDSHAHFRHRKASNIGRDPSVNAALPGLARQRTARPASRAKPERFVMPEAQPRVDSRGQRRAGGEAPRTTSPSG